MTTSQFGPISPGGHFGGCPDCDEGVKPQSTQVKAAHLVWKRLPPWQSSAHFTQR
jgi:hypothetical protein